MREYEIYFPVNSDDARASEIEGFKQQLVRAFGGYTHLNHRSEGAWKMGGVTFKDEVTIVRVIDDGVSRFDWLAFKDDIARLLKQDEVLIVMREIERV